MQLPDDVLEQPAHHLDLQMCTMPKEKVASNKTRQIKKSLVENEIYYDETGANAGIVVNLFRKHIRVHGVSKIEHQRSHARTSVASVNVCRI